MNFRDLREHVEEVPLFEASVIVRAEVALDRAYALNEVEATNYIRNRLHEVLPQFSINRIKVNHKTRSGMGGNIWETEVALQGNVHIDKPVARDEIKNMVRDLTTRVGFNSPDVDVRGAQKVGTVEKQGNPNDREVEEIARQMLNRQKKKLSRDEIAQARRGDRLTVQRAGFSEQAEVRHVDKYSDEIEVRFESDNTVGVIPFYKVEEVHAAS